MVPFAGWEMPVQYKEGVLKSHLHTRTDASLFDVSHMGSLHITGKDHIKFLESITVADVQALKKDQARLSSILTDKFTIIDDCMITRRDNHVYMVINAGCFDKDMKHINAKLAEFNAQGGDCKIDVMQDRALLAIQGPKAAAVVQQHLPGVDLAKVNFMSAINATFVGAPDCIVSRCGYTGEDGFEIHVPAAHAARVAHTLLKDPRMLPAGLGARDSLRLEAGLCLYGHDLDETVTPIEATLLWTITKRFV
jgi:aminomethyltransferase